MADVLGILPKKMLDPVDIILRRQAIRQLVNNGHNYKELDANRCRALWLSVLLQAWRDAEKGDRLSREEAKLFFGPSRSHRAWRNWISEMVGLSGDWISKQYRDRIARRGYFEPQKTVEFNNLLREYNATTKKKRVLCKDEGAQFRAAYGENVAASLSELFDNLPRPPIPGRGDSTGCYGVIARRNARKVKASNAHRVQKGEKAGSSEGHDTSNQGPPETGDSGGPDVPGLPRAEDNHASEGPVSNDACSDKEAGWIQLNFNFESNRLDAHGACVAGGDEK